MKYYDLYISESPLTACGGGVCLGHALSEVSGWYNDRNAFLTTSYPWSIRSDAATAYSRVSGSFYYSTNNGGGGVTTFRSTLVKSDLNN